MAWYDEMVPLLRVLINDYQSSTTYVQTDLEQLLVVAAYQVNHEVDFDTDYTITISDSTISPDPTTGDDDVAFINLVTLKAAEIILQGEYKEAASNAIKITDGPSSVSVDTSKEKKDMYEKMRSNYYNAKVDFTAGNARAGQAIMTPYTVEGLPYGDNFTDYTYETEDDIRWQQQT